MALSRDDILAKALALRDQDRAELAGALIKSLESEPAPGVTEAWREEIERRLHDIDTGAVKTESWESVRERLARAPRG
jgi:putative addiction module component (TIGR02574 family)